MSRPDLPREGRVQGRLVRAGLAGLIVVILLYGIDIRDVISHLEISQLWGVLAAQPVLILAYALFALRSRQLLREEASLAQLFNAHVLPIGLNLFLPARLSELVKPIYLAQAAGVPLSSGFALVVSERVLDIVVLFAAALITFPAIYFSYNTSVVLLGALILAVSMPWIASLLLPFFEARASRPFVLAANLGRTLAGMAHPRRYTYLLILTLAAWFASALSVHVALRTAGALQLDIRQSISVFLLTLIGGLIAVLPAGVGTFQAAAMVGLVGFGYSTPEALMLAIMLQITALVYAGAHAALVLLNGSFSINSLKRIKAARP